MKEQLSFDDVLISPSFSHVRSRKDVDLSQTFLGLNLRTPIISSNMDTITECQMASAMALNGGIGCLHRFCSIEDNIEMFTNTIDTLVNNEYFNYKSTSPKPMVSVGVGKAEYERALALIEAGATHVVIDVAHGASIQVVEQFDRLRNRFNESIKIIVGNFARKEDIQAFNYHSKEKNKPDAYKVGIGGGSLCTTRIVTGCGVSTLSSIIDCASLGVPIIADGGIKNSGDVAKALAAGASVVMLGKLLAGTDETPGELLYDYNGVNVYYDIQSQINKMSNHDALKEEVFKKYRGSASKESYQVQSKESSHRTPEGESTLVPYVGSVSQVLQDINAGLRSALSYTGSFNLKEFKENAELIKISNNSYLESLPHGKKE